LHLEHSTITGGTLTIYGTLDSSGDSGISAAITNNGTIEITSGTLTLSGSISGGGSVVIDADAILAISGTDTQPIELHGDHAGLPLLPSSLSGTIKGLTVSDKIDLSSNHYDLSTTTATYDALTGVLKITDSYGDTVSLTLSGDYSHAHFAAGSDGHG